MTKAWSKKSIIVLATLWILWLSCVALGQQGTAPKLPPPPRLPFGRIPDVVRLQVDALGDRARTIGKEQTTYVGEFLVSLTGTRSFVQVIYQSPGMVRLEGFNRQGVVSFDGARANGVVNQLDEQLLEIFLMDTVEGMLSSLQQEAGLRFVGNRFSPANTGRGYAGPRFDIFEVTAPVLSDQKRLRRQKTYYFDSDSGLLQRTQYNDRSISRMPKVEIRFSQWQRINGSLYARRIERYEDNQLTFAFTASEITAAPRGDAVRFR